VYDNIAVEKPGKYRVAQKVSHYQMIKKLYHIVLKPVSEIRFIRHLTVRIKHYNIIRWN